MQHMERPKIAYFLYLQAEIDHFNYQEFYIYIYINSCEWKDLKPTCVENIKRYQQVEMQAS